MLQLCGKMEIAVIAALFTKWNMNINTRHVSGVCRKIKDLAAKFGLFPRINSYRERILFKHNRNNMLYLNP